MVAEEGSGRGAQEGGQRAEEQGAGRGGGQGEKQEEVDRHGMSSGS